MNTCKMHLKEWETVLVEWVNCLKLSTTIKELNDLKEGEFFCNLQKLLDKSEAVHEDVLTFIFKLFSERYPNFTFTNQANVHLIDLSENDLISMTSLLMHFTCIVDRRDVLTSPLCHSLTQNTQLSIKNFLERVSYNISNAELSKIIWECVEEVSHNSKCKTWISCGDSPPSKHNSPLMDILKTPASKIVRIKEKDRLITKLKSELELERFEKSDLQIELKRVNEKNEKLDKLMTQKNNEISRLRNEVMALENQTPCQDIETRDQLRILRCEIQSLEQYIQQSDREEIQLKEERDAAKALSRKLESQCATLQEKFLLSESSLQSLQEHATEQEASLKNLRKHCRELENLLEEYRGSSSNASLIEESFHGPPTRRSLETTHSCEDLAHSVVDVQLRDAQKQNEQLKLLLTESREKSDEAISNLEASLRKQEETCESLLAKIEDYEMKITEKEQAIMQLGVELQELKNQTKIDGENFATLSEKHEKLQLKLKESDDLVMKTENKLVLSIENAAAQSKEITSLKEVLLKTQADLKLSDEMVASMNYIADEVDKEVTVLKQIIEEKENYIQDINKKYESTVQETEDQLSKTKTEVEALKQLFSDTEEDHKKCMETFLEESKQNDLLIKTLYSSKESLEHKLKKAQTSIRKLSLAKEQELALITQSLSNKHISELSNLNQVNSKLQLEIDNLNKVVMNYEKTINNQGDTILALNNRVTEQVNDLEIASIQIEKQRETTMKDVAKVVADIERLKEALTQREVVIKKYEQKVKEHELEIKNIIEENKSKELDLALKKLRKSQTKIKSISSEKSLLESRIEQVEKDLDQNRTLLKEKTKDIDILEQKNVTNQKLIKDLEMNNYKLDDILKNTQEDLKSYTERYNEISKQSTEITNDFHKFEDENCQLKSKLEEAQKLMEQNDKQSVEMQKIMETLDQKIASDQIDLLKYREELTKITNDFHELQDENSQMKSSLDEAQKLIEENEKQNVEILKTVDTLEQKLSTDQIDPHKSIKQQLLEVVKQHEKSFLSFYEEKLQLEEKIIQLQGDIGETAVRYSNLELMLEEKQTIINSKEELLNAQQQTIANYMTKQSELQNTVQTMVKELGRKDLVFNEILEKHKKEMKSNEILLQEKEICIKELKATIDQNDSIFNNKTEDFYSQIHNLTLRSQQLEKSENATRKQLEESENSNNNLNKKTMDLVFKNRTLQKNIEELLKNIRFLNKDKQCDTKQIEELYQINTDLRGQLETNKTQLEHHVTQHSKALQCLSDLKIETDARITDLTTNLHDIVEKYNKLAAEHKQQDIEVLSLQNSKEKLLEEKNTFASVVVELQKNMEEYHDFKERVQQEKELKVTLSNEKDLLIKEVSELQDAKKKVEDLLEKSEEGAKVQIEALVKESQDLQMKLVELDQIKENCDEQEKVFSTMITSNNKLLFEKEKLELALEEMHDLFETTDANAKVEIEALKKDNEDLQNKLVKCDKDLNEQEGLISTLRTTNQSLSETNQFLTEELATLKSDFATLEASKDEFEIVRKEKETLQTKLLSLDMENSVLQKQLQKIMDANETLENLCKENEIKFTNSLESKEALILQLQLTVEEQTKTNESLHKTLANFEAQLASQFEQIALLEKQLELSRNEVEKIKRERNEIIESQTMVMKETENNILRAHENEMELKNDLLKRIEIAENEKHSEREQKLKLENDLQKIRQAYGEVMSTNSKLELEMVLLRKKIEERNGQLGEYSLVKEAYEKLLEENNKIMTEIDTIKYKRSRDRDEYVRLLKKEREECGDKENMTIRDIRMEYETKLGKMKDKMLLLYREEVNKETHKLKKENTFFQKTIDDLRNELFNAEQKLQQLEFGSQSANSRIPFSSSRESLRSVQSHQGDGFRLPNNSDFLDARSSISSFGRDSIRENNLTQMFKRPSQVSERASMQERRASTLPRAAVYEETVTTRSQRRYVPVPSNIGHNLQMEDEEETMFNDKFLTDLKEGRCLPTTGRESTSSRCSELAYRNSLVPAHLKSSYPAETQFVSPHHFKEEDLKTGNLNMDDSMCKLLPGEKVRQRKDFGTTSYKRPGPPTPSKNGGRTSLQGNEVHPLRELNDVKTPKKTTPSRLKDLFRRSGRENSESQSTTPRSKRLSIFRNKK